MEDIKNIGLKIKKIRKSKKLSQEKLAEMVSMNTKSIIRLENAQGIPSIETIFKIANVLEIKVTDLFENHEFKNRKEIIEDINKCMNSMSDAELRMLYKSTYYFIH